MNEKISMSRRNCLTLASIAADKPVIPIAEPSPALGQPAHIYPVAMRLLPQPMTPSVSPATGTPGLLPTACCILSALAIYPLLCISLDCFSPTGISPTIEQATP
jgi:hypothetical protein